MWAQLSFPVHIDQTSDLSFLLRRLYSFSSIVIFFPLQLSAAHQWKTRKTSLISSCVLLHCCYGKQFLDMEKILLFDIYLFRVLLFHFTSHELIFFQLLRNYMYRPIVILFLKALHIISTLQPGRDGTILIWHRGPKDIRILRKVQHVQALRNPFLDWKRSFWKNE